MPDRQERVVLVDANDVEIGTEEKLQAHRDGALHRAFSVFVLNERREVLLQRRAPEKYHTGGLWSNTCCGHPRPGEDTRAAAERRLHEEMGFTCELQPLSSFVYRAELADGLAEHEFDHVFVGSYQQNPEPNPEEVVEWRWEDLPTLLRRMETEPESFTPWFRGALEHLLRWPPLQPATC